MDEEKRLAIVQTFLTDVYDVHYMNQDTKWKWLRWFRGPANDLETCHKWVHQFGKGTTIGDLGNGVCMVHIPANKFKTTFRIVRMTREIIQAGEL